MTWDFERELAAHGPLAPVQRWSLPAARAYCRYVTTSHYENFSVASLLLPRRLLRHFHAIYAYCRWSDDLGDETGGGARSLSLLDWWRGELLACHAGRARHPVMVALRETVTRFAIPPDPFLQLLTAFTQDQRRTRYERFEELLDYCRHSANPVGHLVLYLFGCYDPVRAALADEICTGLQLANFWQDVARDLAIGRIYLPAEDRERFGVSESELAGGRATAAFRELMCFQVERTHGYFDRGAALLELLPTELRCEVELFLGGGRAVLRAIERAGYDVLSRRPVVSRVCKLTLMAGALIRRFGTCGVVSRSKVSASGRR